VGVRGERAAGVKCCSAQAPARPHTFAGLAEARGEGAKASAVAKANAATLIRTAAATRILAIITGACAATRAPVNPCD